MHCAERHRSQRRTWRLASSAEGPPDEPSDVSQRRPMDDPAAVESPADQGLRQGAAPFDVPPEQADFWEAPAAVADAEIDRASEEADAGSVTALGLLREVWGILRGRLLAVLVLMSLQDAAIFACQRLADLATNYAAVAWLRGPYTRAAIGRMAWPVQDPTLDTFAGGYVWLKWVFQGASLPVKLAVQALAAAALFALVEREVRTGQGRNPFKRLAAAVADAFSAVRAGVPNWRRAYIASAWVLLRFLPLGVASCAIIPLYWTLPRILGLQAAVPAAVSEGLGGKAAVQRSHTLLAPHARAFVAPFLLLMLAPRAVLTGKNIVLSALPPRLWAQVQELPLLVALGSPLLAIVLFRLQELLPIVVYKATLRAEQSQTLAGAGASTVLEEPGALPESAGQRKR